MKQIKSLIDKALESASISKNQRQFLWLLSAITLIMAFVKYYKTEDLSWVLLPLVVVFILISFTLPVLIKGPLVVWYVFSLILSEITSTLFLGVIYFTIIVLIKTLTRKNKQLESWVKRDKVNNFDELY